MKAHPIADLFPTLEESQLKELAADIKVNGLRDPIITYEDQILDGRNRYAACRIAQAEPEFEEYEGDDPLGYVISHNLMRRHLSTAERAEIAARIVTMAKGDNRYTLDSSNGASRKVGQKEAAEKMGVSVSSVKRAAAKSKGPKGPKENKSWTIEDLKKDEELLAAFKAIDAVYGHDDTKAIRNGTMGFRKIDVLLLAKVPEKKMREMQDLIMANHWTPKECIDFLGSMPTEESTVENLQNWCLSTKGKFYTADIGGFTITCKANRAITRGITCSHEPSVDPINQQAHRLSNEHEG
jgi:hypothetical protein